MRGFIYWHQDEHRSSLRNPASPHSRSNQFSHVSLQSACIISITGLLIDPRWLETKKKYHYLWKIGLVNLTHNALIAPHIILATFVSGILL